MGMGGQGGSEKVRRREEEKLTLVLNDSLLPKHQLIHFLVYYPPLLVRHIPHLPILGKCNIDIYVDVGNCT
jgi:hypothetical protein